MGEYRSGGYGFGMSFFVGQILFDAVLGNDRMLTEIQS